jgi:RND family efflux transporter MFP subunit
VTRNRRASPGLRLLRLFGAFTVALAGCSGAKPEPEQELVVSVRTAYAVREPITPTASALGSVYARQEAVISTSVAGRLVDLRPLQNTTVKAGQVLAVLDAVEFFQAQKELRQAQSVVGTTEALAARRRALFEQGGIAKKDLEETELALASAREDLRAAEHTVGAMSGTSAPDVSGRATVRAPFAGVIAEQMQFGGEYVSEGTPLFRLVDVSGFVVKVAFPDTVGTAIADGSAAMVQDEATGGGPVAGVVAMVSRTTDRATRTLEVWVRIDDPAAPVRVGDAARVTAPTRSDPEAVVVPAQAVQLEATNGSAGSVMVVDEGGVAHEVKVEVGIRSNDKAQITEGLVGGEQVVIEGNYGLPDGTLVKVEEGGPTPAPAPTAP